MCYDTYMATGWRETEKIRSEINTNYAKYEGKEICIHASYDLDGKAYFYYFENMGFDRYRFIGKEPHRG